MNWKDSIKKEDKFRREKHGRMLERDILYEKIENLLAQAIDLSDEFEKKYEDAVDLPKLIDIERLFRRIKLERERNK